MMTRGVRRRAALLAILAGCVLLGVPGSRTALAQQVDEMGLEDLPPEAFLRRIRAPLRQDAWGEFLGRITHSADGNITRGDLRVRLTFSVGALRAQIVLNETNVYAYEQIYGDADTPVKAALESPPEVTPPGLFDFGVQPEDVTFAFVYWELVRELEPERVRRHPCRVLELANPREEGGHVRIWFSASRGYPLRVEWFAAEAEASHKELELKGAKKHDDDLWFVKEMRLAGEGWKTRVKFDHAEINRVDTTVPTVVVPPPVD